MEKLAASVADGDEIDWDASERDAGNEVERRVIRDLRVIARISAFCRTHTIDDPPAAVPDAGASTGEPPAAAGTPNPSLGHWGPFELLQKLGEGAFGDVYRARDALQRDVALKLLRPSTTTSAEQLKARILHEGRVLARVRHPNVVTVYGAEEHDGRVGLWMEFIQGQTLEAQLRAQGPLGGREAALVGRELCRALAAVHGAGLVHRDIKAQNVMREAGGRLVLMDFGAGEVLQTEAQRASGRVTGTPLYLAPELLTGSPATVRSDIYSLGVLLYHLVTNAYPVKASTLEELRLVHRQGRRRRLTDARPDLPDDFVRAVERALDPDPQRRFESAGAFSEALSETLSDTYDARPGSLTAGDVAVQPAPAADRRLSWLRKRPFLTLAASVLIAGLGGWAGVVWLRDGGAASSTVPATAQKLRVAIRAADDGEPTLSSALADQVRSDLGASPHLRVIAAAAVEALSGRPASALQQSLNADVVVEIAGRQEGNGRAATVRVIRGSAPAVLLSSHVDDRSNIQNLARDLSERVVSTLEVRDRTWKPSPRTELPLYNPDALQAFRRGEAALARGGREDVIEAARMFRNATMLAPEFVLAYAKWAEALLSIYRHNAIDGAAVFPVVQDAIAQALQRDEASGEAYAALADLQVEKDRDWARAEATFRRAIELSPSSDYARIRFAMMLSGRGRTDEAVAETLEAQSLNPRSSALRGYAGAALHYARRYEEAARTYEGTLQLDSSYTAAWIGLCKAYTALQRFDQAVEACEKVRELGAAEPTFVESQLVQVYGDAKRMREARQHLQALEKLYRRQPDGDTAFWLALAHASLGEADAAFKYLDESIEKRSSRLLYARVDSRLDPIRKDPRFAEREARMDAAYK
ncbi:MAG TPA: protein kinase [Vicinamibacterales bacterium]